MKSIASLPQSEQLASASGCPVDGSGFELAAREQPTSPSEDNRDLWAEAQAYLALFEDERGTPGIDPKRLAEIQTEVETNGMYWQTYEELAYGSKVAWRNNTRCIGRLQWKSLEVRDMRCLSTAGEVFDAIVEHIRLTTNGGRIRPMITVFAPQVPGRPGIRIWNPQLIRYAGYRQLDNSLVGDPLQAELTAAIRRLGWKGGEGTPFDVLPLVIQMPHRPPALFELPYEVILEVPISHPDYPWFADLGLKWYAFPGISNMRLEIGGISYTAAPFSGWYTVTEIGARNFGDDGRYNMLPVIAQKMGLDTRTTRTLWKDRALIELNIAVLHSFSERGVTMVDHHTATRQFVRHEELEKQAGRITPAQWSWIVPPISGSTTPVFHRSYKNIALKPNFFYQSAPWKG